MNTKEIFFHGITLCAWRLHSSFVPQPKQRESWKMYRFLSFCGSKNALNLSMVSVQRLRNIQSLIGTAGKTWLMISCSQTKGIFECDEQQEMKSVTKSDFSRIILLFGKNLEEENPVKTSAKALKERLTAVSLLSKRAVWNQEKLAPEEYSFDFFLLLPFLIMSWL